MEDTNADKRTQEIFAFRKLELTNPDFNARMMQEIAQEKFARQQRQIFIFWLLVMGTLEMVVALLLWLFQVTLSNIAAFPFLLIDQAGNVIQWIIEQHYLFIYSAGCCASVQNHYRFQNQVFLSNPWLRTISILKIYSLK